MGLRSAVVDKDAGTLTLVLDLDCEGVTSKSGKTRVVASTHGNQPTDQTVKDGKPIVVGVNAYFKP